MSQAIVDPAELRRFAQHLKHFNQEVQERLSSLSGQMANLGDSWRDQEHEKFVEQFEQHVRLVARSVEMTNDHVPFLLRKADQIEKYLEQR